jgi:spore coat polysaccharide biosynthesis predicted glycosyltransferase SpsG
VRIVGAGSEESGGATVCVVDAQDPTSIASSCEPDRLVVFDDSERFEGRAAAIVQPSMPVWQGRARAERVLAGYGWAPIGAAWRRRVGREPTRERHDRPRVFVCFGGSDPGDVTGRLGPAVATDEWWDTTIVVGRDYRGTAIPHATLVRDPADLPALVAEADVVLIGGGTMKFEVAALGRPAILVAVADDQVEVGPAFAGTGAAVWVGDGRTVEPGTVRSVVGDLLADGAARGRMADAARRTVDGGGADRLAAEILRLD